MRIWKKQLGMLATGGVAAILASSCCIGPLLLVSVGLGGAWVGNLQMLEPLKPLFIVVALLSMALAYRKIYRPVAVCAPGEVCALPQTQLLYKTLFWLVLALIASSLVFPYIAHYFY